MTITKALVDGKDGKKKVVTAEKAVNNKDQHYTCPKCNDPLRVHKEGGEGKNRKQSHYQHPNRNNCEDSNVWRY